MRHTLIPLAAACGLALASAATTSHAAGATRQYSIGASASCRPALPSYDGAIRTRPLAMANEGGSSAFITCSNWSTPYAENNYNTVVTLTNRSAIAVNVTCTLVAGEGNYGLTYTPQTLTLQPNGSNNLIWGTLATANLPGTLRFSCSLPPGVELGQLLWGFVV